MPERSIEDLEADLRLRAQESGTELEVEPLDDGRCRAAFRLRADAVSEWAGAPGPYRLKAEAGDKRLALEQLLALAAEPEHRPPGHVRHHLDTNAAVLNRSPRNSRESAS